jgi:hypothetical protein
MRISEWATKFGYKVIPAKETSDAGLWATGETQFVIKDVFTTLNGLWNLSNQGQPGCIPTWALADYAIPNELGGATHLFAKLLGLDCKPAMQAQFALWSDGYDKLASWDGKSKPTWMTIQPVNSPGGWSNVVLYHSSGYAYERGEHGPWCVCKMPGLSDVVTGLGLPDSWHISTFMVFQEVARDVVVVPPSPTTIDLTDVTDALALMATASEKLKAFIGRMQK